MKLGKLAPRRDPRNFRLSKYLSTAGLPLPPVKDIIASAVPNWPLHKNDVLGDCTCCAVAHQIEAWTYLAGTVEAPITDDAVVGLYDSVNGGQDNGAQITDVLDQLRKVGLSGHKILGYAGVNWLDPVEFQTAMWLFGGLDLGIAMPRSVEGADYWDVDLPGDTTPGGWGGHSVCLVGYSNDLPKSDYDVISWGRRYSVSAEFIRQYCEEAWCLISEDWISPSGTAPSGFDLAALKADLNQLASA